MLPWGTDQTWADRLAFDGEAGLMFDKCLADASCAALYRDAVGDVRSSVVALDLDSRAASLAAMLEPWQEADPRREYSMDAIRAEVSATRAYLALRPGDVDAWLAPASTSARRGSASARRGSASAPRIRLPRVTTRSRPAAIRLRRSSERHPCNRRPLRRS